MDEARKAENDLKLQEQRVKQSNPYKEEMDEQERKINGNEDIAQYYDEQINRLNRRKQELDNMNPFARWWHCEMQFRKSQREHQKAIKEYKKRMGIWW